MKKWFIMCGVLLGLTAVCHAGIPVETYFQNQPPLSNKSIVISTSSSGLETSLTMSQAPGSFNSGGLTTSCRNCWTKFVVQMSTNVVLNVVDGLSAGTTVQVITGIGLGASGVNTISLPEDHLGPMCLTAGNTTVFNAVVTVPFSGTANPVVVNAEGYTQCGGTNNAGIMQ